MKQFRSVSPNDPVMRPIMDSFGYEGYGKFIAILEYCLEFDVFQLDIEMIKKLTASNARGSAKVLPLFQETLVKVLPKFGKTLLEVSESLDKVSESLDKVSESLPKLEAQNPHDSTHAHARAEREREISNLDIKKDLSLSNESDEEKKLVNDGIEHFIRCGNPNYNKFDWIPAYLIRQWRYIQTSKPEMDVHQFFNEWCSACEASAQKGAGSHRYYAKTFESNLNKWTPQTAPKLKLVGQAEEQTRAQSKAQELMAAKRIRHTWEHDLVIETAQIQCGTQGDMYFGAMVVDPTLFEPVPELIEETA